MEYITSRAEHGGATRRPVAPCSTACHHL